MKKAFLAGVVLLFGVSISLTAGAERAAAQGPAGTGAAEAAQDSSHSLSSLNPIKWVKKDSKDSTDSPETRSDLEKKLTPGLQTKGILAANTTATEACEPFTALDGCLAALHASHDLGVNFLCVRAAVTGVLTGADLSSCKIVGGEKPHGLSKTIRELKPDVNAKQAAKDAEQQAEDDLKAIGG